MAKGEKLREVLVNEVFRAHNTGTLYETCDTQLGICPPNASTQQKRRVYYLSYTGNPYEFNVNTKINIKLNTKQSVKNIASICGIYMGVKCMIRDNNDYKEYVVAMDNTTEEIIDSDGQENGYFTLVLSSLSKTTDLSEVGYILSDKLVY